MGVLGIRHLLAPGPEDEALGIRHPVIADAIGVGDAHMHEDFGAFLHAAQCHRHIFAHEVAIGSAVEHHDGDRFALAVFFEIGGGEPERRAVRSDDRAAHGAEGDVGRLIGHEIVEVPGLQFDQGGAVRRAR
jgi:hypothetical protein